MNSGSGAPVHAVVFDFYGTLTPGTSVAERDAARIAVADVLHVEPNAFAAAVRGSFGVRACGSTGDLATTLRWLAGRCGVEPSDVEVERACAQRLLVERVFMQPRAETIQVLAALKAAGQQIGVLSDCTHELPMYWPDLPFAPFVDAAVFSVETGRRKPDPAMYADVCERIGVDPSECLYVGDGGSNELTGARAAGLHPVQLCGPEFATCHTYDAEAGWDGHVILDLREVLVLAGVAPAAIP